MTHDNTFFDLLDRKKLEEEIRAEEKRYSAGVMHAVRQITLSGAKLVFLSGPSCSGKTTTGQTLIRRLKENGKKVFAFSTDDFFFDQHTAPRNPDGSQNFDHFSHVDSAYLCEVLKSIGQGKSVLLPVFDFPSGKRKNETSLLNPTEYDIVILEGIHALNQIFLEALPDGFPFFTLYICVTEAIMRDNKVLLLPDEVRFCRRLIRDFKHRNASAERTFVLWENVLRAESQFIEPFIMNAKIRLSSDFEYELGTEKEQLISILKEVQEESPFFDTATDLIKKLSAVRAIPESMVPKESVLCEFIH